MEKKGQSLELRFDNYGRGHFRVTSKLFNTKLPSRDVKVKLALSYGNSPRAATSNSPTRGRVKIPHLTQRDGEDDYALAARLATRSAASFSRQLLPSYFSR